MHILVTGANGFLGKNFCSYVRAVSDIKISTYVRTDGIEVLNEALQEVDAIIHFAGSNRPLDEVEFQEDNFLLTKTIASKLRQFGRALPIIFSSSIQVEQGGSYGESKKLAENTLREYHLETGGSVYIFRLPNVFGKWAKPNYNSVVATFCYNLVNNIPIKILAPENELRLVHVDDVSRAFLEVLNTKDNFVYCFSDIQPEYKITVGHLASKITHFKNQREECDLGSLTSDLDRLLYATFLSYLPKEDFVFKLKSNSDSRGNFVEFVKSKVAGQVSFFTAKSGVTRGGHFHNRKVERFLVIQGCAEFCFKHIDSAENFTLQVTESDLTVVETVPGWAHSVTNIGDQELLCIIWANEIFDLDNPDTFSFCLASEVEGNQK